MLSEAEVKRAIESEVPVIWTRGYTTYEGTIEERSSRGLWFVGKGGRTGTERIVGSAQPSELSFPES